MVAGFGEEVVGCVDRGCDGTVCGGDGGYIVVRVGDIVKVEAEVDITAVWCCFARDGEFLVNNSLFVSFRETDTDSGNM